MRSNAFIILPAAAIAIMLAASPPALAQKGRQGGIVVDENGNPISGAEVKMDRVPAERSRDHKSVMTGDDGRFLISRMQSGQWQLAVTAPGFAPHSEMLDISEIERGRDLRIVLSKRKEAKSSTNLLLEEANDVMARGRQLVDEGKYDEAVEIYQQFLAEHPDLYRTHLLIGEAYEMKGEYDTAIASYAKVLEVDPDNFNAILFTGNCYIRKMDYGNAKECFSRLAELRSDDANIMYTLGEVLLDGGQIAEASMERTAGRRR